MSRIFYCSILFLFVGCTTVPYFWVDYQKEVKIERFANDKPLMRWTIGRRNLYVDEKESFKLRRQDQIYPPRVFLCKEFIYQGMNGKFGVVLYQEFGNNVEIFPPDMGTPNKKVQILFDKPSIISYSDVRIEIHSFDSAKIVYTILNEPQEIIEARNELSNFKFF